MLAALGPVAKPAEADLKKLLEDPAPEVKQQAQLALDAANGPKTK